MAIPVDTPALKVTLACLLCFLVPGCTTTVTAPPLPPRAADVTGLLLIVHGSGDSAGDWPAEVQQAIADRFDNGTGWDVVAYDWNPYAADKRTASETGLDIGRQVGELLAADGHRYETIHFLAHSVGAFVAHGAVQAYAAAADAPARIHLTLLDPFTLRGLNGIQYGSRHFGLDADFAEVYCNTDDPVPSTNTPLAHAHNFDVTAAGGRTATGADAHWWPVVWYLTTIDDETSPWGFPLAPMATGNEPVTREDFPAGETTTIGTPPKENAPQCGAR